MELAKIINILQNFHKFCKLLFAMGSLLTCVTLIGICARPHTLSTTEMVSLFALLSGLTLFGFCGHQGAGLFLKHFNKQGPEIPVQCFTTIVTSGNTIIK